MKRKAKLHLADKKECTGCMVCVDACRKGVLSVVQGVDGHYYPSCDMDTCLSCGACEKVCPVSNKMQYGTNNAKSKPYAAWTVDNELISRSASGGVFAAVATCVLDKGGYVIGVQSMGKTVRHIVIDNKVDLPKLQGSKYQQSETKGIYRKVKELLIAEKTVLFSGTGCQVAALHSFLGKEYANLLTMDLVCAGVPSSLLMSRFCSEEGVTPDYIRWRDKENGWQHGLQLTIVSNSLKKKWKTQDCFFGGGFLGGMTSRYSCYNCRFSGTDRKADFTIADYWGCKKYKEQCLKGISALMIHTPAGASWAKDSGLVMHSTTWQDCTRENPRILLGKRPLQWMLFERWILPCAFKYFSYDALGKIYTGNIRKDDWLWLPYKMFKYVRWKLMSQITKKQICQILKKI